MDRRNLVLTAVVAAIFLDTLTNGIIIPILPIYSKDLGASPLMLGIIFTAYSISLLAGTLPLGRLSDRYGRKKVMSLGLMALSLSTLGFALAKSIPLLILARLVQGFSAAATWTAGPALVADLFPPDQRGVKMGLVSSANGFGFLVGPAAGGLLYQYGGYQLPFVLCTILSVLIGIFIFITIPEQQKPIVRPKTNEPIVEVLRNYGVMIGCLVILMGSIGFGIIDPLLPSFFVSKFKVSPGVTGLLFAIISLLHISSAPLIGKLSDRFGRIKYIKLGLITTALAFPLITVSNNLINIGLTMGLLGITLSLMLTPTMPLVADSVMPQNKNSSEISYGAAFGLYNIAFSLGYLVGPLMGGTWLEFNSLASLFLLYSIFLIMIFLLIHFPATKKAC